MAQVYNSDLVKLSAIPQKVVPNTSNRMHSICTTKSKSHPSEPFLFLVVQLYRRSVMPLLAQLALQSPMSAHIHLPSSSPGSKYSDNSATTPILPTLRNTSLFRMLLREYTPKRAASTPSMLVSRQTPRRRLRIPSFSSWPTISSVRLGYSPPNQLANISPSQTN